jgi:hypothetical protein
MNKLTESKYADIVNNSTKMISDIDWILQSDDLNEDDINKLSQVRVNCCTPNF